MIRTFKVVPYTTRVVVIIAKDLKSIMKEWRASKWKYYNIPEINLGGIDACVVEFDKENVLFILLPELTSIDIIVHECVHLWESIKMIHEFETDYKSQEVQAYGVQDIFKNVYGIFKKYK